MRKAAVFLAILVIASASAYPQLISFKLTGGMTWIDGDDYNKGIAGQNQYLRDATTSPGSYGELKSGFNGLAEIIVHTRSGLAFGFGGGYYRLGRDSAVSGQGVQDGASFDFTSTFKPRLSVIPLFMNLHYFVQLAAKAKLDVYAGPVFQVVQFTFENPSTSSLNAVSQTVTYTASQTSFGFQAGAGLGYDIMAGVALIVDASYRSGKATNFMGNWAVLGTSESGTINKSSAESYMWAYSDGKYSHLDFFDLNGPTGDAISGARKADIRLSGIAVSAGLKIYF